MGMFAVVFALWGCAQAFAQTEVSLLGSVTDESKAVMPGVTVTATDLGAAAAQFAFKVS